MTFETLGDFMQYLTIEQNKSLLKVISFDNIKSTSTTNIIKLFEKLSTEQINKLIPVVDQKLASYLSKHVADSYRETVVKFIKNKVTEDAAAKKISGILEYKPSNKASQNMLKKELLLLICESCDQDQESKSKKI